MNTRDIQLSKKINVQHSYSATSTLALADHQQLKHRFFKSELDLDFNRLALRALTSVLQGDEEEAIKLAMSTPHIFFVKSTAPDYAMDLEGNQRIIEDWSAYQAMFGTRDNRMLKQVKPVLDAYLTTLPHGKILAYEQEQDKFPNGFHYPESTYNFDPLVQMITDDQLLIDSGKASDATLAILATFRAAFKPGIVKTGHHFNLNDLFKAITVQDQNWRQWNEKQLSFFCINVIGFLERLLPAPYMERVCGIKVKRETSERLKRDYIKTIFLNNEIKSLKIFPLDSDPAYRLGADFYMDCNWVKSPSFKYDKYSLNKYWELNHVATDLKNYIKHTQREIQEQLAYTTPALTYVLQGNEAKVIELAKSQPELFFIKSSAVDYAIDLQGNQRIIEGWSAYQAMFGTGDDEMLKKIKPYLDTYLATLPDGQTLACDQEQEKFPNGFDYPESTYDFDRLIKLIKSANWVRPDVPDDLTWFYIHEFQAHFKPGIVKAGHHFNMNDFVKALTALLENWKLLNRSQLSLFSIHVLGFLERLIPAPFMQKACRKYFENSLEEMPEELLLPRSYKTLTQIEGKKIEVFPLDADVTCRLGEHYFINGLALNSVGKCIAANYDIRDLLDFCKTILSTYSDGVKEVAHKNPESDNRRHFG